MLPGRLPLIAAVSIAGVVVGYAIRHQTAVIAVLAVGLAAMNGYSKAYSP
jgi:uncharacterized membrane protein